MVERPVATEVLPAQVTREDAEATLLRQLPGVRCMSASAIYHPYAGLAFQVEQTTFGRRMAGEIHTMVDMCNGSAAICEPWPQPGIAPDDAPVCGPEPVLDEAAAERRARQCVVRAVLHRRLSLNQPRLHLTKLVAPMHKPNWLLLLRADGHDIGVLVDGLSGIYHTVPLPEHASTKTVRRGERA